MGFRPDCLAFCITALVVGCAAATPPSPAPSSSSNPTVAPASTATSTPSPASTPSPGPTPDTTATTTLPPSASPLWTATPVAGDWTQPAQISEVGYSDLSFALDEQGHAHVAAATFVGDGVWYLTNEGGDWVAEQVSVAPRRGADTKPSLAVDAAGSTWIVFARWRSWRCDFSCSGDPDGWYVTSKKAGQWSEPIRLPNEVAGGLDSTEDEVALAARDGQPHAVIQVLGHVWYATDAGDGWTAQLVSNDGHLPTIAVPADGRARIAFGESDGWASYAEAATTTGGFATGSVPGTAACCEGFRGPNLILGGTGQPILLFGDGTATYVTRTGADGWTPPDRAADQEYLMWGSMDANGWLHTLRDVYFSDASSDGLWYATNATGAIETHRIHARPQIADGSPEASSLALDRRGRPHVLYVVLYHETDVGLWYVIGPAS